MSSTVIKKPRLVSQLTSKNKKVEYNPYGNNNGLPLKGMEDEFFEFAAQKRIAFIKSLSKDERIKALRSQKSLHERMRS